MHVFTVEGVASCFKRKWYIINKLVKFYLMILMATGLYWCLVLTECLSFAICCKYFVLMN